MNVKDFYFELPQELIAQDPLEDRAASRLLVLDKKTGDITHRGFRDVLELARRPFAASHSNSRTVCPHPRNLTDWQARELAARTASSG